MSVATTLLSAGALLASGTTPGAIFLDGSSRDFSVASCTAESVVITGAAADTLEPGHILAYTESNIEAFSDENVCATCSPLFRKIVSRDGDTFTTEFATIAEIFPKDLYDPALAELIVEPLLGCEHSRKERRLDDGGSNEPAFCADMKAIELGFIFTITAFSPSAICLLPILFILEMIALAQCDDWDLILNFPAILGGPGILPEGEALRKLREEQQQGDPIEEVLKTFPNTNDEWMATDKDGHCTYSACELKLDGTQCFKGSESASSFCHDLSHGMFDLAASGDHDFSEPCSTQSYCYSSKFSKTVCDVKFYKAMQNTCPSPQNGSVAVATTFPLTSSVLSHNCHMISILFYLGAKLFGRPSFDLSQFEQQKYCGKEASTVQF